MQAEGGVPTQTRSGSPPISLIVGLITGVLLLASTRLHIRDVDLYWHLLAGEELRSGVSVNKIGTTWSFAPDPMPWMTTQWMSEVILEATSGLAGWTGLVVLRTVTAAIALALLAQSTLRGRPVILAGFPYVIAATAAVAVSQERSNQASLMGAAILGGVLVRALEDGQLPRWWLILPGTWVWANLHGGWVLVPITLSLVVVGRLADHGLRDRGAWTALGMGAASVIAGTLTPAGTSSTFAIVRFSGATDAIQEWRATAPFEGIGFLTAGMAVLAIVALSGSRPPISSWVTCIALLLFSWTAVRNVAPALLLLAPLVAERLKDAFPNVGTGPEPRWSAPAGILLAGLLMVAGLAALPGRDLLPRDEFPVQLAKDVGELPGAQRVLNDYNVAGLVLYFAGDDDRVAIDGRTDRYGARYIEEYIGMKGLEGDWETLLDELRPTSALLKSDSPLAHVLVAEQSWTEVGREGKWVLLAAPDKG
jgi:hypothetical protein